MRDFNCPNCGQRLAFENSLCLSCGSRLGFSLDDMALLVIASGADSEHGAPSTRASTGCAPICIWPSAIGSREGADQKAMQVVRADPHPPQRQRHQGAGRIRGRREGQAPAIVELYELKLPIVGRDENREYGLAFDLLSSEQEQVMTGHHNGVITLDLAEGDDVHREQLRVEMDEPYRALLGHFRHEIGHYYFYRLVGPSQAYSQRFRELFGDPDADYQAALDRHYKDGPPPGWEDTYVSSYATMHPAEDWAETFAHYLHIRDTLDTAAAFGFAPAGATFERRVLGPSGFDTMIEMWLPLAWALNMINRSMGKEDLYPFVLPPAVLEKMRFIHTIIDEITSDPAKLAQVSGGGG